MSRLVRPPETPTERVLDVPVALARRGVSALLRTWLRLDVGGLEHLPLDGGLLVAATHQSHADALAIGAALQPRRLVFLGAADLAEKPVIGPMLPTIFGVLPVERGAGDGELLPMLAAELDDGIALALFPEGTRSRDGSVHRCRSGTARLAAMTGVPVLPVGVTGTQLAWPIDERPVLRPVARPVRVRVGAVLAPPDDTARSRRAWSEELQVVLGTLAGRPLDDAFAPAKGGDA